MKRNGILTPFGHYNTIKATGFCKNGSVVWEPRSQHCKGGGAGALCMGVRGSESKSVHRAPRRELID
jgi:hypothetical protein